jgi:hypothetical protein
MHRDQRGAVEPGCIRVGVLMRNTTTRNRIREALKRDQAPCHICGGEIMWDAHHLDPLAFQADHVVSLHRGGPDTLDNSLPSHRKCNREKSSRASVHVRYETTRNW